MTDEQYETLKQSIEESGFFLAPIELMSVWSRVIVCSRKRPDGGYGGNSFWVTSINSDWYLGTWGGSRYRLPKQGDVAKCCIAWLLRMQQKTVGDFDDEHIQSFGLVRISEEAFDRILLRLS